MRTFCFIGVSEPDNIEFTYTFMDTSLIAAQNRIKDTAKTYNRKPKDGDLLVFPSNNGKLLLFYIVLGNSTYEVHRIIWNKPFEYSVTANPFFLKIIRELIAKFFDKETQVIYELDGSVTLAKEFVSITNEIPNSIADTPKKPFDSKISTKMMQQKALYTFLKEYQKAESPVQICKDFQKEQSSKTKQMETKEFKIDSTKEIVEVTHKDNTVFVKTKDKLPMNVDEIKRPYYIDVMGEITSTNDNFTKNHLSTAERAKAILAFIQLTELHKAWEKHDYVKLETIFFCILPTKDKTEFRVRQIDSLYKNSTFLFSFNNNDLAEKFRDTFYNLLMETLPLY